VRTTRHGRLLRLKRRAAQPIDRTGPLNGPAQGALALQYPLAPLRSTGNHRQAGTNGSSFGLWAERRAKGTSSPCVSSGIAWWWQNIEGMWAQSDAGAPRSRGRQMIDQGTGQRGPAAATSVSHVWRVDPLSRRKGNLLRDEQAGWQGGASGGAFRIQKRRQTRSNNHAAAAVDRGFVRP